MRSMSYFCEINLLTVLLIKINRTANHLISDKYVKWFHFYGVNRLTVWLISINQTPID